ncbi:MAG TPA: beta-propeller domain-containing protein [Labilithrix sp.]|nr:beta-propeller domain-containing protein [Labilithrix sp.]
MHTKTAFVLLAALASAAATGCSSGGSAGSQSPTGTTRASLHRAKSCGDLLADLKADAAYKLNKGIDRQIQGIQACQQKYDDSQCASGGYYYGGGGSFGGGREVATSAEADNAASPAPPAAPTGGAKSTDSATSYSETNTQVKGVDEADIVKNDGKNLYVLHGRAFKIVNAWPANELKETSSLDIEGTPTEMFVADGKVVVYSQVNGAAVFTAAGVTPKTQYTEYGYAGDAKIAVPPTGGTPGPYVPLTKITVLALDGTTPRVTREVYFEGSYLDSRRVGQHVRTVFQGHQYGPQLKYSIYETYPQATDAPTKDPGGSTTTTPTEPQYPKTGTETISALEKLRATNLAILDASQLGDWLPYTFVKNDTGVSAQTVKCEDFYVPTTGSTESGLTEVASLDLADPTAIPQETAILGRADTVYGNADTLYLAAQAWVEPPFAWYDQGDVAVSGGTTGAAPPPDSATASSPGSAPTPAPTPSESSSFKSANIRPLTTTTESGVPISHWSTNRTHVHKFEFKTEPKFPNYVASGTVAGNVKNQFSLDEKDNLLRIATTEGRQYVTADGKYVSADSSPPAVGTPPPVRPASVNHLFVLSQNGPWLEQTGDVGDLAPNEQIYSVRFVEHRGYVVTFRQVDPLFVVDLTQPSAPQLLAALKIPGFSEYMHPLDANHLLTIGRDAGTDGRVRGLQLQIFDVTNGSNPIPTHKFTYTGDEYGQSEAQYDHKAFTYFADKKLLAFPYVAYGGNTGGMRSSLELFKVDLAAGFNKLGSIDHTALLQASPSGYCGGYYAPSVRRGVFLENFVYSVSYGGIVVKDANDLGLAVGQDLQLPSPQVNEGYGPSCY